MKKFFDLLPKEQQELELSDIPVAWIPLGMSRAISQKEDVLMTDDEFEKFIICYDTILPFNWDRENFRGIKIKRT